MGQIGLVIFGFYVGYIKGFLSGKYDGMKEVVNG